MNDWRIRHLETRRDSQETKRNRTQQQLNKISFLGASLPTKTFLLQNLIFSLQRGNARSLSSHWRLVRTHTGWGEGGRVGVGVTRAEEQTYTHVNRERKRERKSVCTSMRERERVNGRCKMGTPRTIEWGSIELDRDLDHTLSLTRCILDTCVVVVAVWQQQLLLCHGRPLKQAHVRRQLEVLLIILISLFLPHFPSLRHGALKVKELDTGSTKKLPHFLGTLGNHLPKWPSFLLYKEANLVVASQFNLFYIRM